MTRVLLLVVAVALVIAGATLGYIAIIAMRRSEGVFLPAGYAAVLLLVGAAFLIRFALKA